TGVCSSDLLEYPTRHLLRLGWILGPRRRHLCRHMLGRQTLWRTSSVSAGLGGSPSCHSFVPDILSIYWALGSRFLAIRPISIVWLTACWKGHRDSYYVHSLSA